MKKNFFSAVLGMTLMGAVSTQAGPYFSPNFSGGVIPDNNPVGFSTSQVLSTTLGPVSFVQLTLNFNSAVYLSDLTIGYLRLGDNPVTSPSYDLSSAVSGSSSSTIVLDVTSAFSGKSPNNDWTLFFQDTSAGGEATLDRWSLQMFSATTVPEPVTYALVLFGLVFFGIGARRFYLRRRRQAV